jgi:hypothetical protein
LILGLDRVDGLYAFALSIFDSRYMRNEIRVLLGLVVYEFYGLIGIEGSLNLAIDWDLV